MRRRPTGIETIDVAGISKRTHNHELIKYQQTCHTNNTQAEQGSLNFTNF